MLNQKKQIELIMYLEISTHISDGIHILITDPEDIRYRLPKAWMHSMYLVNEKLLPDDLKQVWNEAIKKMKDSGIKRRKKTCVKIVNDFYFVYERLQILIDELEFQDRKKRINSIA